MRFEYYCDVEGRWRWRLKAANNEIVAQGQSYADKRGVLRGIAIFERFAVTEAAYCPTEVAD